MFERIKVDNFDQTAVPVELTLAGGDVVKGRVLIAAGRNLFEVLNAPGGFVEFEQYGGERAYVAKSVLQNVKLVNVPKLPNLVGRPRENDDFNPLGILGLGAAATFDEVKAAWHRLAKVYHPDRYSTAELPQEVRDYLAIMARRINAAYDALETAHQTAKRVAAGRSAPIYSSRTPL